jgi:hypothetical protein
MIVLLAITPKTQSINETVNKTDSLKFKTSILQKTLPVEQLNKPQTREYI